MTKQNLIVFSFVIYALNNFNCQEIRIRNKKTFYFSSLNKHLDLKYQTNLNSQKNNSKIQKDDYQKAEIHAPFCESSSKIHSIKIDQRCETIFYPIFECSGVCHSTSVMWKNIDEIQDYKCCTIKSAYYDYLNIYCSEQLDSKLIETKLTEKIKDEELFELFKSSFEDKSWKNHSKIKNMNLYSGYYTIKIIQNVKCECKFI